MAAQEFCAYEHTRTDTNAIFYVGKGSHRRAYSKHSRNKHWHRVVAKAEGYSVRIIADNIDEELAFLIEIERIDQLKRIGLKLTNKTDGGEGQSGRSPTEETRRKLSASLKGIKRPPFSKETRMKMSAAKMGVPRSEETKQKISTTLCGSKHSEERKLKMAAAHLGVKQAVVTCPMCNKSGGVSPMKRYHFDNCKLN